MRLFNKINRNYKIIKKTKFYREFVNDVQFKCKKPQKVVALNIIGAGAPGESASVSISVSNQDKYLFNCGEDSQRLLIDQRRTISRIEHIFLTQTKWNCIGGISCVNRVISGSRGWLPMFHGPKQLYKCLKRVLCLSIMSELDFKPIDCNLKHYFEDDNLRIDFISTEASTPIKQNHRQNGGNDEVLTFVGEVKAKSESDKNKCVSPTRFMSKSFLPLNFIKEKIIFKHFIAVLDLPTKDHLISFVENQQQQNLQTSFEIIVHFSPKHVAELREYKNLVSSLIAKKHLFLNESNEFV